MRELNYHYNKKSSLEKSRLLFYYKYSISEINLSDKQYTNIKNIPYFCNNLLLTYKFQLNRTMIKNLSTFFVGIALSCLAGCTPIPKETTATKEYAPLEVPVPERPAGQQDVIELTTPKLDTVRVGFIGLGMRGPSAVERWTHIPGTKIVALCDLLPENAEKAQKL